MATPIAMYLNIVEMTVTHWLTYLAPALKGLSRAIGTFLRASFAFTLDIWQLEDDNRHGKLRVDGGWRTTILLGACSFCQNPPFMLQTQFFTVAVSIRFLLPAELRFHFHHNRAAFEALDRCARQAAEEHW
jgi:hypothetical protein